MDDKIVYVIGYEFINNPMDDYGVEAVCSSLDSATEYCKKMHEENPKYNFYIWGDYQLVEE